ncbi:MAG: hypothetical protein AB8B65_12695, partial [Kordia sp.]|uniref:hypothetical protein n=1 Tax=Kordia sp. TaxID=1965332 RepID=UPI00385C6803
MKQKFANYLKLGILLFGITIFLHSCQNDEPIAKNEHSFLKKGKIENYSKLNTFVEKLKEKPTAAIDSKTTSLETTNGFDILYDQDMYIQEYDGTETFSIPIYKNNQLGGTFSNLIVKFSDTEPTEAFILNYDPDDEYINEVVNDDQTPFVGIISSEPVVYNGSLDNLKSTGGCTTMTIKYCNFEATEDGNIHGETHLGGKNCSPGYYWFVTYIICYGDDFPQLVDVPLPGGGNPS